MKRNGWFSRKLIITLAVLLAIGTAMALLGHREDRQLVTWSLMAADILFCQASVILIWGVIRALGNMRMFTSTTYAFKRFHDLFRNKVMKSADMKDDYLAYRESRPYHDEAKPLLFIGAAWLILAVVASMVV